MDIQNAAPYWNRSPDDSLNTIKSSLQGLSQAEAENRLVTFGPNLLHKQARTGPLWLLLNQFKSPLVLILVFAAVVSILTGEWIDATIVIVIIFASAVLGFIQEYNASNAVEKLRSQVKIKANVLRNGQPTSIVVDEVVPGDVALLSAGSLIPADGIVLQSDDFFVNQAVLTGETFPVEKKAGTVAADASLAARTNCVFMGTNVSSGSASVLILETGQSTEYGRIAGRLSLAPPETSFERGIRKFGNMLTQAMMVLVLVVFAVNVILKKPPIDSLLFSIALAVGMAPELLPAIISITLAKGAQNIAKHGVIVRRLTSIENFGSMDVLCTDKTGTLTLGVVHLDGAFDVNGKNSELVEKYAYLNAHYQTGLSNPLDDAIMASLHPEIQNYIKTEEIPYDFVRKRLSVAVKDTALPGQLPLLITKGALENILAVCTKVMDGGEIVPLDKAHYAAISRQFSSWSEQGYRVLGLAVKEVQPMPEYPVEEEAEMQFCGFLLFFDPPKQDVQKTINDLRVLGVNLKVITGDNRKVAEHVARTTGLGVTGILTGAELNRLHEEALWQKAENVNIFAEVDPNQKERIISALRKTGHVVGYMGDGINDAPALHTADVGISVDTAVDVAKQTADFVLMEQSLDVLRQGIEQGRLTFANTLKYVFTTTSANFGNMFSMAGLSLFLPFLPLMPKQILLNNFLSDFPAMTIANDDVDPEMIDHPQRWDIRFIRNFMIVFGLISSVFDYLTFGILIFILHSSEDQFRTGWFIESLLTELFILLIVRTQRPLFRSKPGKLLWMSSLLVAVFSVILTYLPMTASVFGFTPLPIPALLMLLGINLLYIVANEIAKKYFYKKVKM